MSKLDCVVAVYDTHVQAEQAVKGFRRVESI